MSAHREVRKWTTALGEAVSEGILSAEAVLDMCLAYMSEDDVQDMCHANDVQDVVEELME